MESHPHWPFKKDKQALSMSNEFQFDFINLTDQMDNLKLGNASKRFYENFLHKNFRWESKDRNKVNKT